MEKDPRLLCEVPLDPKTKIFMSVERVRAKCFFGCGCYGKNGGCPPYSLTPMEFIALATTYSYAVLYLWRGANPEAQRAFQKFLRAEERRFFLEKGHLFPVAFHAGPCRACELQYPKECPVAKNKNYASCLAPKKRRNSLEACGVNVFKTLEDLKCGYQLQILKKKTDDDKAISIGLLLVE